MIYCLSDSGFMLFQPTTTSRSLNENLDFLKVICRDNSSPGGNITVITSSLSSTRSILLYL